MAIPGEPTLSTRIRAVSRGAGRSAVGMAAYIAGDNLTNDRTGERFDFRHRSANVEFSELMLPEGAPEWAHDRGTLWNRAAAAELRADSQEARDFRFGFSYDLTADQRRDLARQVAKHFTDQGMFADVAVHRYSATLRADDPRAAEQVGKWQAWGVPFVSAERSALLDTEHVKVTSGRDGQPGTYELFQPHCHIQLGLRPFDPASKTGFAGKTERKERVLDEAGNPVLDARGRPKERTVEKSLAREWNDQKRYEGLRGWIADLQNAALAGGGSSRRLDPRGYEIRREEALDLADAARANGREAEADRQDWRAARLLREPEPYLGAALRVKQLVEHVRDRYSQWVAVRHNNRIRPQLDELWKRDRSDFVAHAQSLIDQARRGLGFGGAAMAYAGRLTDGPGLDYAGTIEPARSNLGLIGRDEEEHDLER